MGVMIGFVIGYVMGTREGENGFEELKATVASITSSEQLREFVMGGLGLLADVVKSSAKTLAERSTTPSTSLRRIA